MSDNQTQPTTTETTTQPTTTETTTTTPQPLSLTIQSPLPVSGSFTVKYNFLLCNLTL